MRESESDALERVLANEETLQPMTGFSTRVMRAVREETTAKDPIAFPWARFLPGFVLNLGLLVGGALWILVGPGSAPLTQGLPTVELTDPQLLGFFWATVTLVGTGALVWLASRWVAPRQVGSF